MSFHLGSVRWTRVALALMLVAGSILLLSQTKSPYTERDKAFYADEALVNFVRPGLVFKIEGHEIASDGTVKVRFRITDPRGLPLDRLGIQTPGTVASSFILARIPSGQRQYVSYTVRTQTSPITGKSAVQAAGENTGVYAQVGEGVYTYTFNQKLPSNYERNVTHSIGVYGSRNLTEFDMGVQYDDDVYNFVPDGSAVTVVRDQIATATCNRCHVSLGIHGGSRKTMELCNLCHTPQTIDPDTGNTVDMPVMTHKIHAAAWLPSVQAGGKYVIIGNQQSVHDYSNILIPSGVNNCGACHQPGPKQADAFMTNPNRAACGACHDDIDWATGKNHLNLPQPDDSACSRCHRPEGEVDFDISVKGAHVTPRDSSLLSGINAELAGIENGRAGSRPTVAFKIKDDKGNVIPLANLNRVALVLSGPTTDYVSPPTRGYISEDPKAAGAQVSLSGDTYRYTFVNAIPADAKGTYTIGIETRRIETVLQGTPSQRDIQYGADNKVLNFSVDGSAVKARRTIVTTAVCNNCHSNLVLHGENRNQVEQCILCHNPVETDAARRPANNQPPESVNMALMIHRIHAGTAQQRDYTIYGFGNTPHNYNHIGYPTTLANCSTCHVNNSHTVVPAAGVAKVTDPRGYFNPTYITTGACLGCHTSKDAASHALANTTTLGESCGACHSASSQFSVARSHAQ
jgi:OmcA/MtrC family decaheme c-type cytochrome